MRPPTASANCRRGRKADSALRWQTVVARPQARTLYEAGMAAETFRTLPVQHFGRESPQYRAAANKLDKSHNYAAQ